MRALLTSLVLASAVASAAEIHILFGNPAAGFAPPPAFNSAEVPTPGKFSAALVATDRSPTNVGMFLASGWHHAPDDPGYAIAENEPAILTLTGLDPTTSYELELTGVPGPDSDAAISFSARAAADIVTGDLTTVGKLTITGLQPDFAREIVVTARSSSTGFARLTSLTLRSTATDLPLRENAIPDGSGNISRWLAQDALDPIPPGSLVVVGSSSIRRWETLQQDFPEYRITQRGYGGSFLDRLDDVSGYMIRNYQPAAVLLWSGTNDVKVGGRSAADLDRDFRIFVGSVHSQAPTTPIILLAMAPTPAYAADPDADARRREANRIVRATCEADPTLHFIDLATPFEELSENSPDEYQSYFSDDTHYSRKGYAVWKSVIGPRLATILPPQPIPVAEPGGLAPGARILFDFGPDDGIDGDSTASPDRRGHHWNHWHSTPGGGRVTTGEHLAGLVTSSGAPTGIGITIIGDFQVNGKRNGGLRNPDPSRLGDFAVDSATADYFYFSADDLYGHGNDDVTGGLMFTGLNPAASYRLRIFASRADPETRITNCTLTGSTTATKSLQTSGKGISADNSADGNDSEILEFRQFQPDPRGRAILDLRVEASELGYLNALELEALAPTAP